ncbi:MAG: hypothetical protein PUB73_06370 [Bacteroidales bacterium]|nr:hypothetical protein [Bacteroidales bacterium]
MSVFATIVIILLVILVIFLSFTVGYQAGMSEGQSRCLASVQGILAKIGEILPTILLPEPGEDVTDDGKKKENEQAK